VASSYGHGGSNRRIGDRMRRGAEPGKQWSRQGYGSRCRADEIGGRRPGCRRREEGAGGAVPGQRDGWISGFTRIR